MSMWVNIAVSVLNIILDAVLIGYFKLGIEYAAIASALSMAFGAIIFLYPFIMKKLVLRFTKPKINMKEIAQILYNGSSDFLGNISGSIISIITNAVLLHYGGPVAVAAYSIIMYIDSLLSPLLFGMVGSIEPVISYNYGAKNYERITEFFKITCVVSLAISAVTTIIMFVFPDFLVGLFSSKSDIEIIQMSKIALLLSAPSYLFSWFSMTVGCFLTGFEKATESMIIMLAESVVLPLVLIVILTKLMGVYGIFLIPTIGGIVSTIIGLVLWKKCVKEEFQIAD